MQPLRARVRNGRLFLEEPIDLPDGEVYVQVASIEEADDAQQRDFAPAPSLTPDEEAGLSAALASLRSGNGRTLEQVQQRINAILRR